MPQKINFEPIQFEPAKIDFEPIQFEPINTGKSHGAIADSLWNFGAGALGRIGDIGKSLMNTPAGGMGYKVTDQDISNFGQKMQNPYKIAGGLIGDIDPTGTIGAYGSGISSFANNARTGNYGGAAVDAGLMALPALGLRRLLKESPPVQTSAFKQLPAMGESSASGPRFFSGTRGIADEMQQYPYTLAPVRTNAVPIRGEGGKFSGAHVAEQPAIVTPNIGAELGATLSRPKRPTTLDSSGNIHNTFELDEFGRIPVKPKTSPMQAPVQPTIASEISADAKLITPKQQPTIGKVTQVIGLGKELASSIDLSAPLRQGINLIHKKEWRDSLIPMVQSWKSEDNFKQLENTVKTSPTYKLGQDAGLAITDRVTAPEDAFISTLAEKIPYLGEAFKASNRAYTGFLIKLRQDSFNSLVNAAEKAEPGVSNNLPRMKELASFVNNATGRGSLGKLEKNSELLNNIFFSPRFVSSRVRMMNPANYLSSNVSAQTRKEYLKSFLATSAFAGTSLGLAKLAGADINLSDPTSSDFLKAKFGNTRVDPFGGYQQYLVAGSRMLDYGAALAKDMATGSSHATQDFGTFKKPSAWETTKRFTEGKFNPVVSFTTAMMNGREFSGVPFEVKSSIAAHFVPMVLRDLTELMQDDPSLMALGLPGMLGMGIQTYSK